MDGLPGRPAERRTHRNQSAAAQAPPSAPPANAFNAIVATKFSAVSLALIRTVATTLFEGSPGLVNPSVSNSILELSPEPVARMRSRRGIRSATYS